MSKTTSFKPCVFSQYTGMGGHLLRHWSARASRDVSQQVVTAKSVVLEMLGIYKLGACSCAQLFSLADRKSVV